MKKFSILLAALLVSVSALAKDKTAVIDTSMGKITVKLFASKTPKTVENFVGLATGKKEWKDPRTDKMVKGKPLYSGTVFHRVIPDFMIQGGDPLGNGTGGPGYTFEDEISPSDSFDKPGILAMANAGPSTNGSQFFITVKPTPWLNGHH
ncbi:MAG: peptidylprolyl isomerase, partial [Bdellovibrionota bacterium]